MGRFEEIRDQAISQWEALQRSPHARIRVGTATCGRAAGAMAVLEAVKRVLGQKKIEATVIPVGCLGLCYAEVLVDIAKPGRPRILYHHVTPELLPQLIDDYLVKDNPRPDLALATLGEAAVEGIPRLIDLPVFKPQIRIALRNCGHIDPQNIFHYIANGGYYGLNKALFDMTPEGVLEEVSNSGLRGRGGAAFPAGQKWRFLRNAPGPDKYLVCNAEEGDPGAFMDKAILESDPHTVLEGMIIAGYAMGATVGFMHIREDYHVALEHLRTALSQMREQGLVGENILGSSFSFDIEIRETGDAYVCGEETALMGSIEGKRGWPRPRPPFPAQAGIWQKPTNVNNVKTIAYVPTIISRGAEWFSSIGTERGKGTAVLCLSGNINQPGLMEVPLGIPLPQVIYEMGGGIPGGKRLKLVQTGGPLSGLLPAEAIDLPVDFDAMAPTGAMLGSGGIIVADEDTCAVDLARLLTSFNKAESCGKCTPCRIGTKHLLRILEGIARGEGQPGDVEHMQSLFETMTSGSLCGLGQMAANPVQATLRHFGQEYEVHINGKRCPAKQCEMSG